MPTLGQVLRSTGLDLRMVVDAGGDPTVRWVAVSELADPTPFLEGGEIVLTTGLATAGWDDEWAAYAIRLAAAGVAALGFGLGLTHAEVPRGLHEAARAADLTVFTVPRAVPFVAVTRTVARLVQLEEEQALRAALAVQRRLARDAIGADGVRAVLRRLAGIVGGDAVVCAADGTVLVQSGRSRRDTVPGPVRALIARLQPEGLRTSHTDTGPAGSTLVQPLGLTGRPTGYLVLSADVPWDVGAHSVIATAATLLSLGEARRADALRTARELRDAAVDLLVRGQPEPAQALLGMRAAEAAPLRAGLFRVLRARVPTPGKSPFPARPVGDSGPPGGHAKARSAADDPASSGPPPAGSARRTDGPADPLTGLEHWAAEDPTARLAAVAPDGDLVVLLADGTDPAGAVAALGPGGWAGLGAAHALAELAAADATARAALTRAADREPMAAPARWDDLLDAGLPDLLPDGAAAAFARRVLGPLAAPSREAETLLTTLDAYQEHHGRLAAVATALGVHRNTVRRRLRRVEDLTGRSPATPRGRAELWVATEIARRYS
jgi:PucR family transcriptional regulator, purine catabolism regulatory protein